MECIACFILHRYSFIQYVFMYHLRVGGGQDEHGAIWRHGPGSSFASLIVIIILILLCWKGLRIGIFINWITGREKKREHCGVETNVCYLVKSEITFTAA